MRQVSIIVASALAVTGTIALLQLPFTVDASAHHERAVLGIAMLTAGVARLWLQRRSLAR